MSEQSPQEFYYLLNLEFSTSRGRGGNIAVPLANFRTWSETLRTIQILGGIRTLRVESLPLGYRPNGSSFQKKNMINGSSVIFSVPEDIEELGARGIEKMISKRYRERIRREDREHDREVRRVLNLLSSLSQTDEEFDAYEQKVSV